MPGLKNHWNKVYQNSRVEILGWYEDHPEPSLRLIEKCHLAKDAAILNVGAGASTLIDRLLDKGYEHIIASDLSMEALNKLKERLGNQGNKVHWIVDDLTRANELKKLEPVDLWHDRAVLHFFTETKDQEAYFELIRKLVRPGGFVIIAAFNLQGAEKCSGLPVYRYDRAMLELSLGKEFALIESFDHTYTMPSGDTREYVYALFRRSQ